MSAGDGDDFSVGAELSVTIEESSLSAVRSEIERELADIPIGVDANVSGGNRLQPRDPSTGQFKEIRGVEQRVIEQTEVQVEILDEIRDILEDTAGQNVVGGINGGGGGGGGFNLGRALTIGGSASLLSRLGGFGGGVVPPPGVLGRGGLRTQSAEQRAQRRGTDLRELLLGQSDPPLQDFELPEVTAEDIVGPTLDVAAPTIANVGVTDIIGDPLSLEAPSLPNTIGSEEILQFLFGDTSAREDSGQRSRGPVGGGSQKQRPGLETSTSRPGNNIQLNVGDPEANISVEAIDEDARQLAEDARQFVEDELNDLERRIERELG
jgi:hypothetical protein